MFVGITRAQEELQISRAGYRDFRGQRKITIPSRFLMEVDRADLDEEQSDVVAPLWFSQETEHETPLDSVSSLLASGPRRHPAARPATGSQLTTAAELASGGQSAPVDPDDFRQGMLVRHPSYGLGRVTALSGSGAGRKATVDFPAGAGRKKFVLAKSGLRPIKK